MRQSSATYVAGAMDWLCLCVSLVGGLVLGSSEGSSSSHGVAIPFGSSALPLTLSLGSLGSVEWLAESICICVSQVLAEPLRGQLYQSPDGKHILSSAIMLE